MNLALPFAVRGQGERPPPAAPNVSASARIASMFVARRALLNIKMRQEPSANDFALVADLLDLALSLAPDDTDVLRHQIEARAASGDPDAVQELTRRLVGLDPRDTVAQLRFISGRINRLQDVDQRLDAYGAILGSRGDSIDPAVRSRIALDAALLRREQGDDEGFARLLARAIELDATNKDAASLAVTYFSHRVDDAAGRLDLLLTLLLADPFDSDTHVAVARELAAAGAYRGAQRFYESYTALARLRGAQIPAGIGSEYWTVVWMNDGAPSVARRLREQVEAGRAELRAARQAAEVSGRSAAGVAAPEQLRLAIEMERVWLMAATVAGDAAELEYAEGELFETLRRAVEDLSTPDRRPANLTEEQAQQRIRVLKAEWAWMALWSGLRLDEAATEVEALAAGTDTRAESLGRLRGWLLLRQGELDKAVAVLEPLAESDPLAALGIAAVLEARGEKQAAGAAYAASARRLAGSLGGVWAYSKAAMLSGSNPDFGEQAARMNATAAAVPSWLETLLLGPSRFAYLQAESPKTVITAFEKAIVTLKIRNTCPIPLAVGPDRPINARLLLVPQMEVGTSQIIDQSLAEVVTASRRLRLLPGEVLEIAVWANAGASGLAMDSTIFSAVRVRWRVVQGFRVGEDGLFVAGPLGIAATTPTISRPASGFAAASQEELLQLVAAGTERQVIEAVLVIRSRLNRENADAGLLAARGAAIAERLPSLSPEARLAVAAILPTSEASPSLAPVDRAILADDDARVLTLAVATRVSDPGAEALRRALASDDPRCASVARRVQARLGEGAAAPAPPPGSGG